MSEMLSLDEHYQKLEQVARDMYKALTYCAYGCFDGCPMLNDGCMVTAEQLKYRLEALGVSVDDWES